MSTPRFAAVGAMLLAAAVPCVAQEKKEPRERDVRRVYKPLKAGKWDEVEKELGRIAARGRGEGTFEDPLEDVLDELVAIPTIALHAKAWCEARKDSALARLVRGTHYMHWAWEARGSGWANSVSEDGWKLFRERLGLAKKD